MDARTAATTIGSQLGVVGAAFYFSPEAAARAGGIGLDVVRTANAFTIRAIVPGSPASGSD